MFIPNLIVLIVLQQKTLLQSLNQDYKVIELDQIPKGSAIQNGLQELTGQRTVLMFSLMGNILAVIPIFKLYIPKAN